MAQAAGNTSQRSQSPKSRRWRYGGSGTDKASGAASGVVAIRTREPPARRKLASAAGRRCAAAVVVQEGIKVAGCTEPWRGCLRDGGV